MPQAFYLGKREDYVLLDSAADKDATVRIGPEILTQTHELGVYVTFSKASLGGQVTVSTAPSVGHTGAWEPIRGGSVDWIAGGRTHYLSIPGVHLALEVRITKPIVGGTVTVHAVGN